MPEIKHNFTGGKMNKDLDERLIPNGQYKDAMNIQVSTSEGSDVGVVQNILGNIHVDNYISAPFITAGAVCVGSVSDEKNDKMYWFIHDSGTANLITEDASKFSNMGDQWTLSGGAGLQWDLSGDQAVGSISPDYGYMETPAPNIIAGRRYRITYELKTPTVNGGQLILANHTTNDSVLNSKTGNNNVYLISGKDSDIYKDNEQVVTGSQTGTYSVDWIQGPSGSSVGKIRLWNSASFDGVIDNIIVQELNRDVIAEYDTKTGIITPVFVDLSGEILKFDTINLPSRNITGINIIDDMLFWTDGYSEPKKINIPRSKQGTNNGGFEHTHLINTVQNYNYNLPGSKEHDIEEGHVTVVKRAPKYPPTLRVANIRNRSLLYTGKIQISNNTDNYNSFITNDMSNFDFLKVGDYFKTKIETGVNDEESFKLEWKNWMPVVLKEFGDDGSSPSAPVSNWRIKGKITDWHQNNFSNIAEVISRDGEFTGTSEWAGIPGSTSATYGGPIGWRHDATIKQPFVQFPNIATGHNQTITHGNVSGIKNDAMYQQVYNSNGEFLQEGKKYLIKWTVTPPLDGSPLQGRVWVTLSNNIVHTVPNDYYGPYGSTSLQNQNFYSYTSLSIYNHTPAGNYERIIEIGDHNGYEAHKDAGVGGIPANALQQIQLASQPHSLWEADWNFWPWSGPDNGSEIGFHVKSWGYGGDGSELVDLSPGAGTTGVNQGQSVGVGPNDAWAVVGAGTRTVYFDHTKIDTGVGAYTGAAHYMWNVNPTPLTEDEYYYVTITVSHYDGTGIVGIREAATFASNVQTKLNIDLPQGASVPVNPANQDDDYDSLVLDETTVTESQSLMHHGWIGKGGIITGWIKVPAGTSATARRADIRMSNNATAQVEVSIENRQPLYFNGGIDNVSVAEIDSEQAQVEVRVDAIDGTPSGVEDGNTSRFYAIDKFDTEDPLFEEKLVRFAYRYKYEDGEYSTFSPFTDVAFSPGAFEYSTRKGYNRGMRNTIKSLTITDFKRLLPKDVTAIDILYKEENSPNIYIVDTIKNLNTTSEYTITSETIKNAAVPSNQLLRPWDNTPKKALAQDIVGNRIVYGNYYQNYNLIDNKTNKDYDLDLSVDQISLVNPSRIGEKSIKSLREYQVGVVYSDEYGRQTPVITNAKSTFKVHKTNASEVNQVEINIHNEGHPVNMKYFKFYIKDTGGEYYNLAMDRYYDAEDDNIWLAFPSADRNKIDVDDYLILKKGPGDVINNENKFNIPNVVRGKAEYKILDIKNEAPDFIKRKESRILTRKHTQINGFELFSESDLPAENDVSFTINHARLESSPVAFLHDEINKDIDVEYYITLSNSDDNRVTDRYKIASIAIDTDGAVYSYWKISLDKPFNSEINSFLDEQSGNSATQIKENTYLNIYRVAPDVSGQHKFDGRFFVKIHNDDIFTKLLKPKVGDLTPEYKGMGISRKIYSLKTNPNSNRIEKLWSSGLASSQVNSTGQDAQAFYDCENRDAAGTGGSYPNSVDAVGLHDRVTDQPNHDDFHWESYFRKTKEFGFYLGTLNGKRDVAGVVSLDPTRDVDVWRDYDAYFRGINVWCGNGAISDRVGALDIHNANVDDQKYEDVWFIDNATTAGVFSIGDLNWDNGWDSTPFDRKNPGTYKSAGLLDWGLFELSFGGIQPVAWPTSPNKFERSWKDGGKPEWHEHGWDMSLGYVRDESFYDLVETNTNYSQREAEFIKQIAIGSQFRFKEDPAGTIYTILDTTTHLRVRYENLTYYCNESDEFVEQGPFTKSNFEFTDMGTATHEGADPQLKQHMLFPFHSRSVGELPSGFEDPNGVISVAHNIDGNANMKNWGLNTEVSPTNGGADSSSGHTIYTSTYCRPSNYTKNWKLVLDKPIRWNPVEETVGPITTGKHVEIRLTGASTTDKNQIITSSIENRLHSLTTPDPTKPPNLEVGMVLKSYDDASDSNTNKDFNKYLIVSDIQTEGTKTGGFTHTINFKTYDGTDDVGVGNGISDQVPSFATDDLHFYQFPMNGLSPNAAKNLNFFRNGKGFDASGTTGTDSVGYTIEWVEEKTSGAEDEILPRNPAIWETKPKESVDTDIYYEASGEIPIQIELTPENIQDYIPIGSLVEYENRPNLIPPGTTVYDIDPENEQIILTSNILIKDQDWSRYVSNRTRVGP